MKIPRETFLRTPLTLSATRQRFTFPRLNFAEAPVTNVKPATIWQPILQRQLEVTMYGGSYVVNLLKQKVV